MEVWQTYNMYEMRECQHDNMYPGTGRRGVRATAVDEEARRETFDSGGVAC
jgi:hypothetical protein